MHSTRQQRRHPWPRSLRDSVGAMRGRARCLALALAALTGACGGSSSASSAALQIDFDGLPQDRLPAGVGIRTQFAAPDAVPGVTGSAWRTDGFSSYADLSVQIDPRVGFTLSLWVALESWPSDREVPVAQLSPSSIAQQWSGGTGFDLPIDTFGRWGLKVATSSGLLEVRAPQTFPLGRWVHVVARVDAAAGTAQLWQDGVSVGTAQGSPGLTLRTSPGPLRLASPPAEARILDFVVNRLNAAYDLVAVHPAPLSDAELAGLPGVPPSQVPDAWPSLKVPESRFAGDALRPRVHPMPPANWTNEPHGLVRTAGRWHLFYQRTPNGPFKTQMHWGHMASADLLNWEHLPDALWPELQTPSFGFDMKGIWSGHVVIDGPKALAFYTSVNHGDRLSAPNPGIAMAVSDDPQLRNWRKTGPILNSQGLKDFRDPFVWNDAGTWHMLIGAALDSGGGLQHLVLEATEAGPRWKVQAGFTVPGPRQLDIGSEIWEMPVFVPLSADVWVLLVNPIGGRVSKYGEPATRAVYWTGTWSGGVFRPFDTTAQPLDLVPGHLAPTVARADDGTLRAIGIVDERRTPAAQQRAGWAHTFSLPRVWSLRPDGRTLGQAPAPELRALRGAPGRPDGTLALGSAPTTLARGLAAYELEIVLTDSAAAEGPITVEVLASEDGREATRLVFDPLAASVGVDLSRSTLSSEREGPAQLRGACPVAAFGAMRTLRVIVDGSTVEAFVNDAAAYAVRSYPSLPDSTLVRAWAATGRPLAAQVQVWQLRRPAS